MMRRIKALLITVGESDPRPPTYLARLFHKPRYDELIEIICNLAGKEHRVHSLLDIGCGKGVLHEWLVKSRLKIETYVGCDIDLKSLREVKNEKVLCDAHHLPFKDRSFDLVVCSEVLEHLKRPLLAFSNILKVSSKWVIVTFPDERIKNMLGFRYPEHISEVKPKEIADLSKSLGYFLAFYKRLYFAIPPSVFDKIMNFSPTKARLASAILQVLSRLLGRLCLIKTVILVFMRRQ